MRKEYLGFKRINDFIFSLLLIIFLSPLLLSVSVLVILNDDKNEFIFSQKRAGKNGIGFTLYKFKTMRTNKENESMYFTDRERITNIGYILRKTSIDELPSIFNILKGEMSFVGPRPLLMEYLSKYNEHHIQRLNLKPGLTGLAQISGRQNLTFSKRFDIDVNYTKEINLFLDLKILFLTIPKIIFGKGVISSQKIEDVDDLGLFE